METILWPELKQKRVLLCVSGGIAAYKAAELCRLLIKCGAQVRVMMTAAAQQFVGQITFAALTGYPVSSDLFDPSQETQIGHIELADISDLLIVAPATANMTAVLAAAGPGEHDGHNFDRLCASISRCATSERKSTPSLSTPAFWATPR